MSGRICRDVRIALGGVTLPTRRARRAEDLLKGGPVTNKRIDEAAKQAVEDGRIGADVCFSAGYKKELLAVMVRRALRQSMDRMASTASREGRRA
jgi:CO/xanthine dehydrogenase FAD-binding subunit